MLTKTRTALAAAIIVGAASGSVAKDGGPPTIDIQKTCQEDVDALHTVLGWQIGQDVSVCMMDEQAARDQLVKDWAKYPTIAKTRCVQTKEYLPGYVEWQSCLEMTRDVLQLRKQTGPSTSGSSASRRSSSRRAGSVTRECPVVKYTDDGSVDYIITNC
jgi:hypothetical protein